MSGKGIVVMNFLPSKKSLLILLILIIVFCLVCSGCSFLTLERKYIPETNNPEWIKNNNSDYYPTENIRYQNISFLLSVRSNYSTNSSRIISIGPPFIPFWPGLLSRFNEGDIRFEFFIDNVGDTFTFDVQGIKIITSGGQVVTHEKAYYCTLGDVNKFLCSSTNEPIPTSPVLIKKGGRFMFSLYYPKVDCNKDLKIEFGQVFSSGININLPPLFLHRDYNTKYCSFCI